jgi:hypothetical protein
MECLILRKGFYRPAGNMSFVWVGNTQAREMGLSGREFFPMVAIPVNPQWLLPPPVGDL